MPIGGFLGALRPAAQALGGIGSILSAVRYAHSRANPRVYHQIRSSGPMPNFRRRRRYGRRRARHYRRTRPIRRHHRRRLPRIRRKRLFRRKRFPMGGRKALERKLLRRARGGGRWSGLAMRKTMTVLTYEEKKYVDQEITKQQASSGHDLKIQKFDWFDNKWLPTNDEVNPIKQGIFANYRYTRLGKIVFCLRNFDEVNMFKFDDDATHMHVPRLLGFRYTTDYQDIAGTLPASGATIDEWKLENRLVRVKNVVNRSQRYAFTFTYKPEYRLDVMKGWIRCLATATGRQSSFITLYNALFFPD